MIRILISVIVKKFYERNAGLFLVIFFMMFGIVESSQIVTYHLSLIYGIIGSPVFLAAVCAVWFLYMYRCVNFFLKSLLLQENYFLLDLNLLDIKEQRSVLVRSFLIMNLPVLSYSLVVDVVSVVAGRIWIGLFVTAFNAALIWWGTRKILVRLNSVAKPKNVLIEFPWPGPRPFLIFYLDLFRINHKIIGLLTKIFSVSVMAIFLQIPADHRAQVTLLGLLFGLAGHALVVFELRKLEDHSMMFMRGLPLPAAWRFAQIAMVYSAFLIPEVFVLGLNKMRVADIGFVFLAALSFLLTAHCWLYRREWNMDSNLKMILALFLIFFAITLSRMVIPASVLFIFLSFLLYQRNYYRYEPTAQTK